MPPGRQNLPGYRERWRRPAGRQVPLAAAVVLLLVAAAALLTYRTGGTQYVYLHVMYIPIILGGYWFGFWGGILTGLVAGLALGPIMPLDSVTGTPQRVSAWLYRSGFFMLIGAFTGQMAHLLNLRLEQIRTNLADLSHLYAHTLKAFASLVAYRDEDTAGHCERVAHNARVVGQELGLDEEKLNYLYWAGILHDLGKVATPTEILLKPGALDEHEFAVIKEHARVGADLLLDVSPELEDIAVGIRCHHERWDGRGYPEGLQGESIHVFGRILAVVDVFEALTSRRPYRGPLSRKEAVRHLQAGAGSHFDPEMVAVFQRCLERGDIFVTGSSEVLAHADVPVIPSLPKAARLGRLN